VESLDGLPSVGLWCVMVQREASDRFFAEPSTKSYGAVSVLVQLAAERTGFHPVSRSVFRPRPNVDSALVAFRRRGEATFGFQDLARVKTVVTVAFAHRRKMLANSLELAGFASRQQAEAALAEIGREPKVRAEELSPAEFVDLANALARE
jgi:16S rRNA (adenine1518-N6/adenine1519-N6)-dimethyltransferase